MKIADLFVAIGISGNTQVKQALGETRSGLNETASSALWTKAAIVGVLYGLEQLVSTSNAAGAGLQQFAGFTGQSGEMLQRYAYAGRLANVSLQDIQGSVQSVQKAMASLETTGQGPSGLWVVAKELGGFDKNIARNPLAVIDQVGKFLRQTKLPVAIANQAAESFGLTPAMIRAQRENAFDPSILAKANIYSDREVKNLAHMNAMWAQLSDKIEKAIGHLNSKHGGQLITDISLITDKVIILSDKLITLAEKLKVFEYIGKSFEGWNTILGSINEKLGNEESVDKKTGKKTSRNWLSEMNTDFLKGDLLWKMMESNPNFMKETGRQFGPPLSTIGKGDTTVDLTQNFYGPTDPAKVGAAAKSGTEKAVSNTVWQSNAHPRKN